MTRRAIWKKILIRNTLFIYGRDTLIFFMNLYIWSQSEDLRRVAIFNLLYLGCHTLAFPLFLGAVKRQKAESVMKLGIVGISATLLAIAILRENSIDYLYPLGIATGFFNGMYWIVNHLFNFDSSSNSNRTKFYSYMNLSTGTARLAVPFIGWIMFALLGDGQPGYNGIFAVAALATVAAAWIVEIPQPKESNVRLWHAVKHVMATPKIKLKFMGGFFWGLALRSALAAVLLPFLIFQVVERESSLSIIQTGIEIGALVATFAFGRYRKNTGQVSKLILLSTTASLIGLSTLLLDLSSTTFATFVTLNIIALISGNISAASMSTNFITTIKDYKKYRAEYIVLREVAVIPGFMAGYVFILFAPDLTISSIGPLIVAVMIATLIGQGTNFYIWRYLGRTGHHS